MSRTLFLAMTASLMLPVSVAHAQEAMVDALVEMDAKAQQSFAAFQADPQIKRRMVSVESGDPYSMVWMGDEAERQLGSVPGLREKVIQMRAKFYMTAAQQNYPAAFARLGRMVEMRALPEAGIMDALDFYQKGAELGDEDAALGAAKLMLDPVICSICISRGDGTLSLEGTGFDYRVNEAVNRAYQSEKRTMIAQGMALLESPLLANNPLALERRANLYLYGIKVDERASQTGQGGSPMLQETKVLEGEKLLLQMSDQGNRWASNLLGSIYFVGFKGIAKDADKFVTYKTRAAEAGDVGAAALLGHEFLAGQNIPFDPKRGMAFLTAAFDKGSAAAGLDLGMAHLTGRGVVENEAMALLFFEEAANRGSSKAAGTLVRLYRDGVGGRTNPMQAKIWADRQVELEAAEARGKETMDALRSLSR